MIKGNGQKCVDTSSQEIKGDGAYPHPERTSVKTGLACDCLLDKSDHWREGL